MIGALPPTSAGALWNYAREVDAAFVTTQNRTVEPARMETERFLFYRGLGAAPLPVRFTPADGGTLESGPNDRLGVQHVFVVRVEGGKGDYVYRPALPRGERATGLIPSLDRAKPLHEMTRQLADDLASKLVASGLYPKEARAMVNTWRTSYFQTEGTRALFVLPQSWTDAFIPLAIEPKPKQIVRVMVGRIELLTPEREQRALGAIRDLSAPDSDARARAFGYLRDQGRYVEPIVRRVLQTTKEAEVKQLCQRLLATDFVTELRAAAHNATDGARLTEDPTYLRAQLAILLKEAGLIDQAKAEGQRALAELKRHVEPPTETADARGYLRAYARAIEATGDDRAALEAYGRFIRFGSQVALKQNCRGCHRDAAGPQDVAWFHDWWAGAKYTALAERLGITDRTIAATEAAAASNPSDPNAHMLLAYLYGAKGRPERAQTHWAALRAVSGDGPVALVK